MTRDSNRENGFNCGFIGMFPKVSHFVFSGKSDFRKIHAHFARSFLSVEHRHHDISIAHRAIPYATAFAVDLVR